MKISTKGEYALRILIAMGQHHEEWLAISELSEKTLVTAKYLEQIMIQLKRFGYVQSKRGVEGGYRLQKPAEQIIIGEVIRQLEGPLAPMGCASVTAYEPCSLEADCLLKPLWMVVRDTISYVLDRTSLQNLLDRDIVNLQSLTALG